LADFHNFLSAIFLYLLFILIAMVKKKRMTAEEYVLLTGVLFFAVWGVITIIKKDTDFIFDRFFSAGLVLLLFAFYKITKLRLGIIIFAIAVLLIHHLKLYGNFYLGIPFDRIMHFTAGIALGLIAYHYLESRTDMKRIEIVAISVLIAAGAGSIMEIIEFVGYSYLGQGEGLLFFGKGDFGEWNNASWDLMNNAFGAILGAFYAFFVFPLFKKK